MGYRSEVAFCLRVKEPEKFIALAKVNPNDVLKEMLDNMYYANVSCSDCEVLCILFKHNYWKWYDDSDQAFLDLIEMARHYDEEYMCKFVRVGENVDDVQEDEFGEDAWKLDFPHVIRTIEIGVLDEDLKPINQEEKENVSA